MDFRSFNLSDSHIRQIHRFIEDKKLYYQPFLFRDDLEVGEGYAIQSGTSDDHTRKVIYWPEAPTSLNKLTVPQNELEFFRKSNSNLRTVYESFIDFICSNICGSITDRTIFEFGCNTGYFLYRFSQLGAQTLGMDQTPNGPVFDCLNEIAGTSARFNYAEWDSHIHNIRYAKAPNANIVLSIAVLCHLPDPLHHLTFLCNCAEEAIFLWTPALRNEEELLIAFNPPSRYSNLAWPLSFDHMVRPTKKLLKLCLEECGFEKMIFLPPIEGVNEWYRDFQNHHLGVLAFRTSEKKTVYNGGDTRLIPAKDAPIESENMWPLLPGNAPRLLFEGVKHNIVYFRGMYMAIPRDLGPTEITQLKDFSSKNIVTAPNLELLMERIPE